MPVLIVVPRVNSKLDPFWWKLIWKSSTILFFIKSDVFLQQKKPPAGLHQTEDRAGDAPKPPFPSKSIENQQKSKNQPPVNHHYSWVCISLFPSKVGFAKSWGCCICHPNILHILYYGFKFKTDENPKTWKTNMYEIEVWDVGMGFRDVGCVRIPFAINSNPFSAHSDWKSIKSY